MFVQMWILDYQIFQSTHSRRVRLFIVFSSFKHVHISIHALTKSATFNSWHSNCSSQISIHALTKSATPQTGRYQIRQLNFNPRTHEECDCDLIIFKRSHIYFNPRTHEECDQDIRICLLRDF